MSVSDILAKIDLEQFKWKPLPNNPKGRTRILCGGEAVEEVYHRYVQGEQILFFGTYISLEAPVPESQLVDVARKVWIALRFDIPTIATKIVTDSKDIPSLVYESEDATGVDDWASRTLVVHKQDKLNLESIREEVAAYPVPAENGDQSWLRLAVGANDGTIKKFGLLFHTHHGPYDGTALKIIFNRYLKRLAEWLNGKPDVESIAWGKELDNLLPPATEILVPEEPRPIPPDSADEPTFAHPYYATLGGVLQGFAENMVNPWTFKPRQLSAEYPKYQYDYVDFSKEESSEIFDTIKSKLSGSPYTVTHLTHAALALVIASDNPPTPEAASRTMFNLSLVDARSRLVGAYAGREGYAGYALGVFPFVLNMSTFLEETGNPLPLDEKLLSKLLDAVRDLYNKQKEFPSQLIYMPQASFIFGDSIKQSIATGQIPPSNYRFASDGRGEKYLDSVFNDKSGKPTLRIDRFFTTLNGSDIGPFFRVASWDGKLELSVDYNSNTHSREEAQLFLKKWKEYVSLVRKVAKV